MDLEEEIGRLFGLPPEEFIAARDQLARQLKAGGDAPGAKRISALRRPTVAAWAVNQAARERPELVRELLEAGDRLHQAQRRALSGLRGGGLREAGAQRRTAVDRLAAVAAEALERSGRSPDPHREAISSTLQAASVDGEAAAALRAGTLSKELAVPSGFGEAGGLALVRPLPAEPAEPEARPAEPAERRGRGGRGGTASPSRPRAGEGGAARTTARKDGRATAARRPELEAARRRLEELRRQADKAERAAARTREAADEAAEAEDAAATEAQRLADGAKQARQAAEAARRAAEQARIAADDARQEADVAKTRSQRAARRARAADGEAAEADDAASTARRELERAERQLADLEPAD